MKFNFGFVGTGDDYYLYSVAKKEIESKTQKTISISKYTKQYIWLLIYLREFQFLLQNIYSVFIAHTLGYSVYLVKLIPYI